MNDKIRDLHKQIDLEKRKMENCNHQFKKPFSNPDSKQEAYGYKMIAQGSDVWHEPSGYHTVMIPRWTRICSRCGFEEHTNKEKAIIKGYTPDFKN